MNLSDIDWTPKYLDAPCCHCGERRIRDGVYLRDGAHEEGTVLCDACGTAQAQPGEEAA